MGVKLTGRSPTSLSKNLTQPLHNLFLSQISLVGLQKNLWQNFLEEHGTKIEVWQSEAGF